MIDCKRNKRRLYLRFWRFYALAHRNRSRLPTVEAGWLDVERVSPNACVVFTLGWWTPAEVVVMPGLFSASVGCFWVEVQWG